MLCNAGHLCVNSSASILSTVVQSDSRGLWRTFYHVYKIYNICSLTAYVPGKEHPISRLLVVTFVRGQK